MKSTPLNETAPMILAHLAGRKSETRVPCRLPSDGCYSTVTDTAIKRHPHSVESIMRDIPCPFGTIGDEMRIKKQGVKKIYLRLTITSVKVERVQEITEEGAMAEGASINAATARVGFISYWNSRHGKGSWERNDYCWVIGHERKESK